MNRFDTSGTLVGEISRLAQQAGEKIMRIYDHGFQVEMKSDASPLTSADRASHDFLLKSLQPLVSGVPVISEESDAVGADDLSSAALFWLVDPLDGTKEFLKRSGEFTVNIGLVDHERPILGVVHAPALGVTYLAEGGKGAFRQSKDEAPLRIHTRTADAGQLAIVASKDHAGPMVKSMLARVPGTTCRSAGSSLKFCMVAEGKADAYLRDLPTMEWDTAAAQCIVEAAGGKVCLLDGTPLRYGKPGLRNPPILTRGDPGFEWETLLDPMAVPAPSLSSAL
jgi:3'(2'), 5'-bisphosphate nucleotidase